MRISVSKVAAPMEVRRASRAIDPPSLDWAPKSVEAWVIAAGAVVEGADRGRGGAVQRL